LNASIIVARDFKLMNDLLIYGLDTLYPRLQWQDKIQIIDMASKSNAPYVQRAFNRIVVDVLVTPYDEFI